MTIKTIRQTIYNDNLRTPDSVTVECGKHTKGFLYPDDSEKVGDWVRSIWAEEFFPSPAYIYYNIDWDCDHVLFCKFEATEWE